MTANYHLDFGGTPRIMRILILTAIELIATLTWGYSQTTHGPSFDVASVKPAAPAKMISCSGGPGTSDPGLWRCSNVPIGFVISQAYGFQSYQFRPNDECCRDRFDFMARVPPGTTKDQFHRMIQNLIEDRFKFRFHYKSKEMPVYELTVAEGGPKLKPSGTESASQSQNPWEPSRFTVGKDGYPVFPEGTGGLAGAADHYHWVAFDLSMQDIVKTLSFELGRPVVDTTGLKGNFDVDLKWWVDVSWLLETSGHKEEELKNLPEKGAPGPSLTRGVHDQLGLKLASRKGSGEIVVIDYLGKLPDQN